MAKIPFNVSARTARLIGRENVASPEGAVIELIKNAYDADSEFGIVDIDYSKNQMLIIDNGDGMTDKVIENHWMTIGTDLKEREYTSNKGRIKSGAKGIGRFALDKLGEICTMITLPRGQKDGFIWYVDWRNFEIKNAKISEINADLNNVVGINLKNEIKKLTSNSRLLNLISKLDFSQGTIIFIKNLRNDWNLELSNKIFTNLEILNPPEDFDKFTINFFNSAFPKDYGLIQTEPFKDYDYKLVAKYEKNSTREVLLKIHRNEFDFTLIDKELFEQEDMKRFPFDKATFKKENFQDKRTFYQLIPGYSKIEKNSISKNIGNFVFTFYFFKNSTSKQDQEKYKFKSFNSSTRKKWASKYGGIKLFRDNFRVRPYGEVDTASYDWLMLGDRVSISPASLNRRGQWRVNPNQVVGTIVFSRLSEEFLDDKSSREGLLESPTFDLFKNIITGLIRYVEDDRSTIGANLSEYFFKTNEEEVIKKEAEDIAEDDSEEEEPEEVVRKQNKKLKKGFRTQKRLLDEKEDELGMMRALASAGILIASFSHEFHHIKNKLNNRAFYLKKHLLELLPESKVKSLENRKNPYYLIDEISKLDEKIKQWIEFSITLTKKDRR
ncbi:ATP-binding protein, partial [Leptospira jelokensis]